MSHEGTSSSMGSPLLVRVLTDDILNEWGKGMHLLPQITSQTSVQVVPPSCSPVAFFERIEAITKCPVELQQHWWLPSFSCLCHGRVISPFFVKKPWSMLCQMLDEESITPEAGIFTVYVRKLQPKMCLNPCTDSKPHLLFVKHLTRELGSAAWQLQYAGSLVMSMEGLRGADVLAAARKTARAQHTAAVLLEIRAAHAPSTISWVDLSHSSMWALQQMVKRTVSVVLVCSVPADTDLPNLLSQAAAAAASSSVTPSYNSNIERQDVWSLCLGSNAGPSLSNMFDDSSCSDCIVVCSSSSSTGSNGTTVDEPLQGRGPPGLQPFADATVNSVNGRTSSLCHGNGGPVHATTGNPAEAAPPAHGNRKRHADQPDKQQPAAPEASSLPAASNPGQQPESVVHRGAGVASAGQQDGQQCCFHCHRVVLISQSPVLRAMLLSPMQEGCQGRIHLQGVDLPVAEAFLRALYGCRVELPTQQLVPLAALADQYHVTWLYEGAVAALLKAARGCCPKELVGLYLQVAGQVGGDLRMLLLQLLLGRLQEVMTAGLHVHLGCEDLLDATELLQGRESAHGGLVATRTSQANGPSSPQAGPKQGGEAGAATRARGSLRRQGPAALASAGRAEQSGGGSCGPRAQLQEPVQGVSIQEIGHVLAACCKGCCKGLGAAPGRVQRALFELYVSWAAHHPAERLGHLRLLLGSLKLRAMSMADVAAVQSHPLVQRALALGEGSTSWAWQACGELQQQVLEVLEMVQRGYAFRDADDSQDPLGGVRVGGDRHDAGEEVEAGAAAAGAHLDRVIYELEPAWDLGGFGQGVVLRSMRQMLLDPAQARAP